MSERLNDSKIYQIMEGKKYTPVGYFMYISYSKFIKTLYYYVR